MKPIVNLADHNMRLGTWEPVEIPLGHATFSPEDRKLRFYAFEWVDPEIWEEFKALSFRSAPKQKGEYAGMFVQSWNPYREELLLKYAHAIFPEDTSLKERQTDRSARFQQFKTRAAERALEHADNAIQLNGAIPEAVNVRTMRKAEKTLDSAKREEERAQERARMAEYWKRRARGSFAHYKRRFAPGKIASRIRTMEADIRKHERKISEQEFARISWYAKSDLTEQRRKAREDEWLAKTSDERQAMRKEIEAEVFNSDEYRDLVIDRSTRHLEFHIRWINHFKDQVAFWKALYEQGPQLPVHEQSMEVNKGDWVVTKGYPLNGYWAQIVRVNRNRAKQITTVSVHPPDRGGWGPQGKTWKVPYHDIQARLTDEEYISAGSPKYWEKPAQPAAAPRPVDRPVVELPEMEIKEEVTVIHNPDFFPTPENEANLMATYLRPTDREICDAGAGNGNLTSAVGCVRLDAAITMVEINWEAVQILKHKYPKRMTIIHGDFIEFVPETPFDVVIMNPPFSKWRAFVVHAMMLLKPGGRLIALLPANAGSHRIIENHHEAISLDRDTFKSTGTSVTTCIFVVDKEK